MGAEVSAVIIAAVASPWHKIKHWITHAWHGWHHVHLVIVTLQGLGLWGQITVGLLTVATGVIASISGLGPLGVWLALLIGFALSGYGVAKWERWRTRGAVPASAAPAPVVAVVPAPPPPPTPAPAPAGPNLGQLTALAYTLEHVTADVRRLAAQAEKWFLDTQTFVAANKIGGGGMGSTYNMLHHGVIQWTDSVREIEALLKTKLGRSVTLLRDVPADKLLMATVQHEDNFTKDASKYEWRKLVVQHGEVVAEINMVLGKLHDELENTRGKLSRAVSPQTQEGT